MKQSVHLQNFPDVSAIAEERQLVADMDRVRAICTAALGVREKENIRVRQPLGNLTVYGENIGSLNAYADIIADELNVKKVVFSSELGLIASRTLKVNFPVAGKRLGPKMKDVAAAAKAGDWRALSGGKAEAGGEPLEPGEFEIALLPKEGTTGAQALSTNDALVVLDLAITPELKAEGLARDVVRAIQQARKDANLNITDRIAVKLEAPEDIRAAISANEHYVKEQVLAASLAFLPAGSATHRAESEVEGTKVVIGFDVAA